MAVIRSIQDIIACIATVEQSLKEITYINQQLLKRVSATEEALAPIVEPFNECKSDASATAWNKHNASAMAFNCESISFVKPKGEE